MTADVDTRWKHGRLRAAGFCWVVENRAVRTELMSRFTETCVESESGLGIDARAGFLCVWCVVFGVVVRVLVFAGSKVS